MQNHYRVRGYVYCFGQLRNWGIIMERMKKWNSNCDKKPYEFRCEDNKQVINMSLDEV